MSKNSRPRFEPLYYSNNEEYPDILCPVCAHKVIVVEDGEALVSQCPHLVFVRPDGPCVYEYESDDFSKRRAAAPDDVPEYCSDYLGFLVAIGYDEKLFVYEVAYSGMGCGPFTTTDLIGFISEG